MSCDDKQKPDAGEEMNTIHKGMITAFRRYLEGVANGEIVPRASMLNTIRQFLRDNGVTALSQPKDPFAAMEEALDGLELPDFDNYDPRGFDDNPNGGRREFN